jgi:hypothetical protein
MSSAKSLNGGGNGGHSLVGSELCGPWAGYGGKVSGKATGLIGGNSHGREVAPLEASCMWVGGTYLSHRHPHVVLVIIFSFTFSVQDLIGVDTMWSSSNTSRQVQVWLQVTHL